MQRSFILNFHGIGEPRRPLESGEERFWLGIDEFDDYLDLIDEVRSEGTVVEITFDDSNGSDIDIALPRLLSRGHKARFFVLASRLTQDGFLSTRDLVELRKAGMIIGSHGYAHVDWRSLAKKALLTELRRARGIIADSLGEAVDEIAVPLGSYDHRVLRLLKQEGFRCVYTSDGGSCRPHDWLKPRTCIHRSEPRSAIAGMLRCRLGLRQLILQDARLLKRRYFSTVSFDSREWR